MQASVQNLLLDLNRAFYAKTAKAFDESRARSWPGFAVAAEYLRPRCPAPWRVLDVGCGNGRLLQFLREKNLVQDYVGIDANESLLTRARTKVIEPTGPYSTSRFIQMDISASDWSVLLPEPGEFDAVFCLATLHHMPGSMLRSAIMNCMAKLLRAGGYLILSNWQPLNSNREKKKILEWSTCGLSPQAVESGDLLISWKREVDAVRYVHVLTREEVKSMADLAGLSVNRQFLEDGSEKNLNLYSVLSRPLNQEQAS